MPKGKKGLAGFPARLRATRLSRGLTQQECGFPQTWMSHFETGERLPSLENFRKLCIVLNVRPDYLLDIEP